MAVSLLLGMLVTSLIGLISLSWLAFCNRQEVSWDQFVFGYLHAGLVKRVEVVNKSWARVLMNKTEYDEVWFWIGNSAGFEEQFRREKRAGGLNVPLVYKEEYVMSDVFQAVAFFIKTLLALVLLVTLVIGIYAFLTFDADQVKTATHQSPGLQNGTEITVRFSDVVGCDEAKLEIMELVNFLKHPEIYTEMGAKFPRGALLTGPPGTGKTFLAKAAAGEAGVSFISASGAEFNELYIGMGALKVRQLFSLARANQPCIFFIDEIDSIGYKRQTDFGGASRESDSTLNQLLVEMDGFSAKHKVIVLAATNRANVLDEALLRPGRLDRVVMVPPPDVRGREELFKKYLTPLHLDVSLTKEQLAKALAILTPQFTGAEIQNVCNEAAILATRHNQCSVEMHNFEAAIDRSSAGIEHKGIELTPTERKKVAYHEAGHAVAGWFSEHADPLLKITIVPHGQSLGFTQFLSQEQHLFTKEQLTDKMVVMMGGRVAETIFFGFVSTGAADDLSKVTQIAYRVIMTFGMSETLGPINYSSQENLPLSEEFAKIIDSEVQALVAKVEKNTVDLLKVHQKEITAIAELLLEKDTLTAEEVTKLIGPRPFADNEKTKRDLSVSEDGDN